MATLVLPQNLTRRKRKSIKKVNLQKKNLIYSLKQIQLRMRVLAKFQVVYQVTSRNLLLQINLLKRNLHQAFIVSRLSLATAAFLLNLQRNSKI